MRQCRIKPTSAYAETSSIDPFSRLDRTPIVTDRRTDIGRTHLPRYTYAMTDSYVGRENSSHRPSRRRRSSTAYTELARVAL